MKYDLIMSNIDAIQGLWRVISYDENGVQRSTDAVQMMARLLILSDKPTPAADGIWGSVSYSDLSTREVINQSMRSLRELINGREYDRSAAFHIYTGGLVSLGKDGSIDFVVYHGPQLHALPVEHSVQRGQYRLDGANLVLCLADSKTNQRPTSVGSTQTPNQSLAVYVREQLIEI
jgi:hypothetical protein